MIYIKTEGLILNKKPLREKDASIYILTKKFGGLTVFGQSLNRPQGRLFGLAQTGTIVKVFLKTDFEHYRLISILGYKFPGQTFKKYPYLYLWALKLIRKLNLLQVSPGFWQIVSSLDQKIRKSPKGFSTWFISRALNEIGQGPNLDFCAGCGKSLTDQKEIYLSRSNLFCPDCHKPNFQKLDQNELRQIKLINVSFEPIYPYPPRLKQILSHQLKLVNF
ncbi:MAG: recombination protein O N-terminal domain-containing protein [Patescibacteria group bacterium]|nr:recombination protein O N-terminal domain-containing protein [Patescibacteria group bacterium]MCL5257882.1 recombination protein O N-terminal domain-containing protein [Patescibacteria group bacterium]